MTTKQQARAITAVEISGKGTRKNDGATVYGATSASGPGRLHLIVWEERQQAWVCDCAGYAFRKHCRHVDALRFHLAAQHAAEVEPVSADDRWSLTEKGAVALAQYRAERERREMSLPRQRDAFSILK
jgi:hypothetical protein